MPVKLHKDYLAEAVLEYCDDLITIKDLNLRYVACNNAFLKTLGNNDRSKIINKSIYDIFDSETATKIAKNLKTVIETQQPLCYVFRINNNKFNKVFKQTSTPIIKDGKVEGVITIASDVTHEENLKSKLLDKIYQINALLDNLPFIAYLRDTTGKFILGTKHSKIFVETGIDTSADNICLNLNLLQEKIAEQNTYVLENKKMLKTETPAMDYDGNQHWYKIIKAPILTEANETKGVITFVQNVDEEKTIEYRKNLFLATLTHDLKNPLQAQISSLELFHKEKFGTLNENQKETLQLIIESSKHMRSMIQTLLTTSKDSNGVIRLQRSFFDISNITTNCINEIKNLAMTKNVKITHSITSSTDNYSIYADESHIRRVIGNFLNNAINYAFNDSLVNVEVKINENELYISFENQSNPISKDLEEHIFDKYVCGKDMKNNFGVGLGLYYCKKVIEAHEGKINLITNNTNNKFFFTLPLLNETSTIISEIVL